MKTILHIIDTTGPGGAETVFIDLATNLPADKYRPVVVIRGKGWVYEELCRRGIKPYIIEAKGSFNWKYLLKLIKLIRRENIEIIQSHLLGSNVYCSIAGFFTRIPVIAVFHGAVDISAKERFFKIKFAMINLGAKAVVAVSESLKQNFIDRTPIRRTLIHVIYNGIKTECFQLDRSFRLRQQFAWNKNDVVIGCLGNIRPAKSYDVLLKAANILKSEYSNLRFVVAGQGKQGLYEDLLSLRTELGLENEVQFLGFCADPAEFLSNLDIFLLTSSSEGFSIATTQAMAANLPVIATRSGGPEEILAHNEDGYLVEPNNPKEIASAVAKVLSDSDFRIKISNAGKQKAIATFDIRKMLDSYCDLYEQSY